MRRIGDRVHRVLARKKFPSKERVPRARVSLSVVPWKSVVGPLVTFSSTNGIAINHHHSHLQRRISIFSVEPNLIEAIARACITRLHSRDASIIFAPWCIALCMHTNLLRILLEFNSCFCRLFVYVAEIRLRFKRWNAFASWRALLDT